MQRRRAHKDKTILFLWHTEENDRERSHRRWGTAVGPAFVGAEAQIGPQKLCDMQEKTKAELSETDATCADIGAACTSAQD